MDVEHPKDVQIKNVNAIACVYLVRVNKISEIFKDFIRNFKLL